MLNKSSHADVLWLCKVTAMYKKQYSTDNREENQVACLLSLLQEKKKVSGN